MSSLDRLVEGLFDYAGLFPPAALPFEEALKTSADAATSLKRPDIIGADFVCGFDLLENLNSELLLKQGFPNAKTFRIAVLGPTLNDPDPIEQAKQIKAMQEFNEAHANDDVRQRIISYEVKLDLDSFQNLDTAQIVLDRVRRDLGTQAIRLYVEPNWGEEKWEDRWEWFWKTLDTLNASPEHPSVCPKVRGSGPTAITVERLAKFIPEVNKRSLPFKATAGLHHPVIDKERYDNNLGFLGLSAALRLHRKHDLSQESIIKCLRETDAENFNFEKGLRWKDSEITAEELRDSVLSQPFGIGSCSLSEPDADLTRLFPSL